MLKHADTKWLDKELWRTTLQCDGPQKVLDAIQDIDERSAKNDVGLMILAVAITAFAGTNDQKGSAMLATWYQSLPKVYLGALLCLSKSDIDVSGVRYDAQADVNAASAVLNPSHALLLHKNWDTLDAKVSCPPIINALACAATLTQITNPALAPPPRPHRL